MKLVSTDQMRDLDRRTIAEFGVPGSTLMDRAGFGVAEMVQYVSRVSGYASDAPILVFAGRGNNGGDALVAARYLKTWGFEVEVWLIAEARTLTGDAMAQFSRLREAGVRFRETPTPDDLNDAFEEAHCDGGIIVDGVLGIGIVGPARGPAAAAIDCINELSRHNLVVAIDVPSGLDADTGEAPGGAVRADVTVTMGLPKRGLVQTRALDYVGTVEVVDIGLPFELIDPLTSDIELITADDIRALRERRPRASHKGDYGHVLIIGGSPGFSGAVSLAAAAASRSGAGLVSVLTPARVAPIVAGWAPEAMVHPAVENTDGTLTANALRAWSRHINEFDAVLIGPGMGVGTDRRRLVTEVLANSRCPVIIDADAINVCGGRTDLIRDAKGPVILTPHPGELARLMGDVAIPDIQSNRFEWARRAAANTKAMVVLKGAGTLVAEGDRPIAINLTGNPGMATGGSGDVLAGMIAGLIAQHFDPFDAAGMGVHLHGRAGDNVAWRGSQAGLIASDLIAELPGVFREYDAR